MTARTESRAVRQLRARAAITASRRTGDILPRKMYELAGEPVPEQATDRLRRKAELS